MRLMGEVLAAVLREACVPDDRSASIVADLQATLARGASAGHSWRIECQARDGQLDVQVASSGGPLWQFSHPLA